MHAPPVIFTFSGERSFTCQLERRRCGGQDIDASVGIVRGCGQWVDVGLPFCPRHARRAYGVEIRPSSVQGAGLGLFATRPFAEDEKIAPYFGERLTQTQLNERYGSVNVTAPYAIADGQNRQGRRMIADAACVRSIASLANHSSTAPNAEFVSVRLRGNDARAIPEWEGRSFGRWLVALRDILPDEEIVWDYGDVYWQHHQSAVHSTS
jgi:hypothetical protein